MKIEQIPTSVVDACRERGWNEERMERADARELFREYCEWHGLINWSGVLFGIVEELIQLESDDA